MNLSLRFSNIKKLSLVMTVAAAGLVGCSGDGGGRADAGVDAPDARTGGAGGRDGGSATGGSSGSGGTAGGAGGAAGAGGTGGGSAGAGAAAGSGVAGATATGGNTSAGGVGGVASGGAGGTAGAAGAGGRGGGGGGTPGSGGSGAGGSAGGGGRVGTGGAVATGGVPGTGGTIPIGGTVGTTGGASGTGGAVGTGGTVVVGTGGTGTGGSGTGGAGTGGVTGTGGSGTGGAGTGGAGTGGAGTGGAGTGGAGTGGAIGTTTASLYVVTHPDDELLFINPDLHADIQAGLAVTTVFLTSGGADWMTRETSVRAAHAAMASVPSTWTCTNVTYGPKSVLRCSVAARPQLTMIFLRIRDDGSVTNLRSGVTAQTVDGSNMYSLADLLATLGAIQAQLAPGRVGTLDGTLAHGSDHNDHVSTGILAFDVARADGASRQLTMYRGYSMYQPSFAAQVPEREPVNLSPAVSDEKLRIVIVYQATPDPAFLEWSKRHYPIRSVSGPAGLLRTGTGGLCLQASGTADGSAVTVVTCNAAAAGQTWTVGANSRVLGVGGRCLGIGSGTTAVIEPCDGSAADQRWTLLTNGQLKGTADSCLTTSGTTTGSAVNTAVCGSDTSMPKYFPPANQRWGL